MENLEHRTLDLLKKNHLEKESFLLGVSGGKDSMALLYVFQTLKGVLKFSFSVAFVHHGFHSNKEYREESYKLVRRVCEQFHIPFISNYDSRAFTLSPPPVFSEQDLRHFRYFCFNKWRERGFLVIAHHSQDLLETRLLRLIRGVGSDGFSSMKVLKEKLLRPFLSRSLEDIKIYIEKKNIPYKEDPSNKDLKFFRNWIRHKWLFDLETYKPGSVKRLAQSFEILSESYSTPFFCFEQGIEKESFYKLSYGQKKRLLIAYMKSLNLKNYGASHVEELLKRLETKAQKCDDFYMLGRKWILGPKTIQAVLC